jgi:hypothetical protein
MAFSGAAPDAHWACGALTGCHFDSQRSYVRAGSAGRTRNSVVVTVAWTAPPNTPPAVAAFSHGQRFSAAAMRLPAYDDRQDMARVACHDRRFRGGLQTFPPSRSCRPPG